MPFPGACIRPMMNSKRRSEYCLTINWVALTNDSDTPMRSLEGLGQWMLSRVVCNYTVCVTRHIRTDFGTGYNNVAHS